MQGKEPSQQSAKARVYIGIDVCKAKLDVYIYPLDKRLVVANDAAGLKQLKKAVAKFDVALVVMEATGKFHRLAHRNLHDSGFKVAIVNPLRSRKFAEAIGTLAKTDRVDARMLAIMGESLTPDAVAPPPEVIEDLQELARGRESFVDDRTAVLNKIGASKSAVLIAELKRQLRALDKAIANLEAEIERRIDADPVLARRFEILTSIPGIGHVAATALIAGMNEIGQLSAKEVTMIVGLAPIACDSGQHAGSTGNQRRAQACPNRPLHARQQRSAAQPRHQDLLRSSHQQGKTPQSRHYRRNAETRHPRKHARARKSPLGAQTR